MFQSRAKVVRKKQTTCYRRLTKSYQVLPEVLFSLTMKEE